MNDTFILKNGIRVTVATPANDGTQRTALVAALQAQKYGDPATARALLAKCKQN